MTLAAVAPVPDTISEFQFAALLRGEKTMVANCLTHDLQVPATAEIVPEGFIEPDVRPWIEAGNRLMTTRQQNSPVLPALLAWPLALLPKIRTRCSSVANSAPWPLT